jgi:hypothetical protein
MRAFLRIEMRQSSRVEGFKKFENLSSIMLPTQQLDHQLIPRYTERSPHLFCVDLLALPLHCRRLLVGYVTQQCLAMHSNSIARLILSIY